MILLISLPPTPFLGWNYPPSHPLLVMAWNGKGCYLHGLIDHFLSSSLYLKFKMFYTSLSICSHVGLAENRLIFSLKWYEMRFQFSLVKFFVFSLPLMLISVQKATPSTISAVNKNTIISRLLFSSDKSKLLSKLPQNSWGSLILLLNMVKEHCKFLKGLMLFCGPNCVLLF